MQITSNIDIDSLILSYIDYDIQFDYKFDLLEQHINELDWRAISSNEDLPVKFFRRHIFLVEWDIYEYNKRCDMLTLMVFQEKLGGLLSPSKRKRKSRRFSRQIPSHDRHWLANDELPEWFYERYIALIRWDNIRIGKDISLQFLESHIENIKWHHLSRNESVPFEFFERHIGMVNWWNISSNKTFIKQLKRRELLGLLTVRAPQSEHHEED